ncbi:hypothetical protein [Derxia lacustris]|uniref:hypothetical protein n=1 Tax=Derxia lacustris TaxID=764842 RepID=UPI000A172435|nr:hypothetical protein [Derxia lacustris]
MRPALRRAALAALAAALLGPLHGARAAPEEITVFTDEFEAPGEVSHQLHLNYVNRSRRVPEYPGEQAPNRVLRAMPETAIGIAPDWNLGIHVPFSFDRNTHRAHVDGLKLRLTNLQVRQLDDELSGFYGANYELSWLAHRLSESRLVAELRGIVGLRNRDWLLAVNPILNRPASRGGTLDEPMSLDLFGKLMRTWGSELALGVEHFAQLGPVRRPGFAEGSAQVTYAVAEWATASGFTFHTGIGRGWRGGDDKIVFKALIGLPFD